MEFERKSFRTEFKARGDKGDFSAKFAEFEVVDLDDDVTRTGAIRNGSPVLIGAYNHESQPGIGGALPTGRGEIKVAGADVFVDGRFFLETPQGQTHYDTVKAVGDLGEWSYVYAVERASYGERDGKAVRFLESLDVRSVDPVLAGAGRDTRTVAIKSAGGAGMKFADEGEAALAAARSFVDRAVALAATRREDGRDLSKSHVDRLESLRRMLSEIDEGIVALISKSAETEHPDPDLASELLRFQAQRARLLTAALTEG